MDIDSQHAVDEASWPSLTVLDGLLLEPSGREGTGEMRHTLWKPTFDVVPFDWLSLILKLDHPDANWEILVREESEGVHCVDTLETVSNRAFHRSATLWWEEATLHCAEWRVPAIDVTDPAESRNEWRRGLDICALERRMPPELPVQHRLGQGSLLLPQLWSPSETPQDPVGSDIKRYGFELAGEQGPAARLCIWESGLPSREALERAVEELRGMGLTVHSGPAVDAEGLGRASTGTWFMCQVEHSGIALGSTTVHLGYGERGYVLCALHSSMESEGAAWAAGRRATQMAIQTLSYGDNF